MAPRAALAADEEPTARRIPRWRGFNLQGRFGMPGPGAIYMSQSLKWLAPVKPGDELTATVTVREIVAEKGRIVLDTVVEGGGKQVLVGEALVMPPRG